MEELTTDEEMELEEIRKQQSSNKYYYGRDLDDIPEHDIEDDVDDTYGYEKNYVYEEAYKLGLERRALVNRFKNKKRTVVSKDRDGILDNVRQVSNKQYEVFTAIKNRLEKVGGVITKSVFREARIRENTVNALEKAGLIEWDEKELGYKLTVKKETDQEIMSKGGVGKVVIKI